MRWLLLIATIATTAESAMKYFVLGAIASGALLYGISWVYGVTGSLQFHDIAAAIAADPSAQQFAVVVWLGLHDCWVSRSSLARCRFTCGCRTSIRAHARR